MHPDALCYLAQAVSGTLYAFLLEFVVTRRRYENGFTWLTVVGGVAMVGGIVAARLAWAPLPLLFRDALVWWVWWLTFWSFVWSAVPILGWQAIVHGRHLAELIAYLRGR